MTHAEAVLEINTWFVGKCHPGLKADARVPFIQVR